MILMVLQRTRWTGYNKHRILHHINKIGLHNTKYQVVMRLGKNKIQWAYNILRKQ